MVASSDSSVNFKLLKVFSKVLPFCKNEGTSRIFDSWPYLKKLAWKITEPDLNVGIEMMLSSNCPKSLQPIEIIPSQEGDIILI